MQNVLVLNTNTKRESGAKVQMGNIMAAKAVADIVRTCLGPRAMLKMVLDAMGGIVLTNDGNAILREVDVNHPAAKSMIDLARTQDENVGDGTTSVIILAGEMLAAAQPWLEKKIHPRIIISGYHKALEDALAEMKRIGRTINQADRGEVISIIKSSLSTKFSNIWSDLMCGLAYDAVTTVVVEEDGRKEIDFKRYAKVEKIPGGEITDSCVLKGVMFNKDVTHAQMRREIKNPRVLLLDCPLEYKKAESQMNIEVTEEGQWTQILRQEEEYIKSMCDDIIKFKPDLVITEKGVSDLAQHYFVKHNITALRRLRKTDNNRIARACGATIVNRTDEIQEADIGTGAGLFKVEKIGDEYFCFITECQNPKACTVLLRGGTKDVLNEIERNLLDAFNVARNVLQDAVMCPGGGATEMSVSQALMTKSGSIQGIEQWTYRSVATALEVIPRTLAQNCGAKVIRVLTELRAKHAQDPQKNATWGIDGNKGVIADMNQVGIWEPLAVKAETIKTAIEAACLLLRVDDVVSGVSRKGAGRATSGAGGPEPEEAPEGAQD